MDITRGQGLGDLINVSENLEAILNETKKNILLAEDPRANTTIVLFNGRPLRHYVSACEGINDGWIDIIDLASMPKDNMQLDTFEDTDLEPVTLNVIRLVGTVEFRCLGRSK